jgi:hypothetical protein
MEIENKKLRFLDVLMGRSGKNIKHKLYIKKTSENVQYIYACKNEEQQRNKTRRFGFKKQANQTRTEKNTPDG